MKKMIWLVSLILITLFVTACGNESSEKEHNSTSLNMNKYVKSFNKIINNNNGNSNIEIGNLEKVKNDRYSISLTLEDNIFLFMNVDKNKNVKSALIAANSDALENYNNELHIAYNSLLTSVDADLNKNQRNAIFDKIGITDSNKLADITETYQINNIILTYYSKIEDDVVILEAKFKK